MSKKEPLKNLVLVIIPPILIQSPNRILNQCRIYHQRNLQNIQKKINFQEEFLNMERLLRTIDQFCIILSYSIPIMNLSKQIQYLSNKCLKIKCENSILNFLISQCKFCDELLKESFGKTTNLNKHISTHEPLKDWPIIFKF